MRMSTMEHSTSSSRTRAGSTASLQKRPDYRTEQGYQSQSDREGRTSRIPSRAQAEMTVDASRYNNARKPINEAVTSAFTHAADTTHTAIPPDLLSQITSEITANVLQQLKANNIPAPAPETLAMPIERVSFSEYPDNSPPLDRKVYTPPSPHRPSDIPLTSQTSPTFSNFSTFSSGSQHVPTSPRDKRAPSPFSAASRSEDSDDKEKTTRPVAPKRISTSGDGTVLERIWGKMFDSEGQTTKRLGQFLRGIAVHIIEDYEPKHSLVITPDKMQRYYEETKLANEYYPWQVIFDDRTSSISRMFREIDVQHHLTQDHPNERPDIPGMTPHGFETWMKLVLKAQPDIEFDRLAKTALNMPISNPDDRKERFPKEISRRLFPSESDLTAVSRLEKIMKNHCGVRLPPRGSVVDTDVKSPVKKRNSNSPPPAISGLYRSQTVDSSILSGSAYSTRGANLERTSQNTNLQDSAMLDELDEGVNMKPIERERKPYVAQPGIGKNYDGSDNVPPSKTVSNLESQAVPPPPGKFGRSPSVTSNGRTGSKSQAIPVSVHQKTAQSVDIPDQQQHHRSRTYHSHDDRDTRNRSPSMSRNSEYGHRSEGDIKSSSYHSNASSDYQPSSYRYTSDRHDRGSFSVDTREKGREPRSRFQSVGGADGRYHHAPEEDYYRNTPPGYSGPDNGYSQYPPSAYRPK